MGGEWFFDLGFAAGVVVVIVGTESVWRSLMVRPNAPTPALLPHPSAELGAWLFVACVVGVCEEIVYRGYLQRQLAAFTRSTALGGILSAVLFGVAHLEQGAGVATRAAVYGLVLGAVAHRRRSLVPGMIAHVVIDGTAALLAAR